MGEEEEEEDEEEEEEEERHDCIHFCCQNTIFIQIVLFVADPPPFSYK